MRHSLARLLSQLLGEQEWNVQKAMDGMQKEAYIAHSRTQKVFLKFDVPPSLLPALERLGEIGVSPPLLAAGTHRRRNYIVQSYLEGVYPDKMWFRTHLPELARFVRAYHRDEELARRLSFDASPYRQHVQQRIRDLNNQLQQAGNETFGSAEVLAALRRFREQARHLPEVNMVPTHGDPSPKNAILVQDEIYLVDWDDIGLSDPMRDIGLMLWWYVPRNRWNDFFDVYDPGLGAGKAEARLYWWVASRSLEVALWLSRRGLENGTREFLRDFAAAVDGEDNPVL